jgi:hypothetical protein
MTTETATDQGESQSVESRIANALGLSNESAEVAEATETPVTDDGFAELDWEGTKIKVPPSLRDAFMKNEDYTRKTQELAEQRKSIDHVHELAKQKQMDQAFHESIAKEQNEIAVIDAYLGQAKQLDWSKMSTDEIMRAKVELDNVRDRRAQLVEELNGKRQKFMDEVQNNIKGLRGKARELASKSIPGFSEEAEKAVRSFAMAEGLTENEVDNVLLDPRSYRILWKASQFDKVSANAKNVAPAVQKTLKPGVASNPMPEDVKAKLNFRKEIKGAKTSGEKAKVIESRLEGLFSRGRQ